MAKIEPAVTQMVYLVPDGTSYIDLAKGLSKVNRRLYRQGYTYVVQDVQVIVNAGQKISDISYLQLSTAGNSWVVHNAWKKGFAAWRRQVREVESGTGIKAGTWNDFKVYLDDSMEDGTMLEPYAADGAVYQAGEWDYSSLVFDDNGQERDLRMHLIGSSNLTDTDEESGIGLINEYQSSRSTVQSEDPSTPAAASTSIYAKLSALGDDELMDDLVNNVEDKNDAPPYDHDDYPGGAANADAAVAVRWLTVTASTGNTMAAGFIAPCGLIKVDSVELALDNAGSADGVYASGTAPNTAVMVTVAPGPYRGVLAAPMGQ